MKTILIIDDEEKFRTLLSRITSLEGFDVLQAESCSAAIKKLEQSEVDVVLCDVKLPDGNGVDLSKQIKEKYPLIEVILLTAYGNIPDGVQAIKNGAFDYITKGDDNNKIIPLLYRAYEKAELSRRVMHLEKQLGNKYSFENVIGKSKSILAAIELAQKVAATETTVLLTGETGTGKEVFAQAIHQASRRNRKNFIAINCAAFSKELLESEMFGHRAGAFTGATVDRRGIFEEANDGTIFLDEIGEMALDLQAKLLRVLETGEYIKLGESKPKKVNVRIIAATNKELTQEIEKGNFREDLFYRISAFQIELPALRDRVVDIPLFVEQFAALFSVKAGKRIAGFSPDFIEALKRHTWHGNIRELRNIIERSVILATDNELTIECLPIELKSHYLSDKESSTSTFDLANAEKMHIKKVMSYTNGNKTEAARLLNIALTTLYRKLAEYGLS